MKRSRRRPPVVVPSAFAGFRFPAEVIMLAVHWYLRYSLSYRDLEAVPVVPGRVLAAAIGVKPNSV